MKCVGKKDCVWAVPVLLDLFQFTLLDSRWYEGGKTELL